MPEEHRRARKLMIACWAVGIALFAFEAWHARFAMTWDGIQYLDDADEYFRGAWASAVNSQWSPLYVWIVGAFLHALQPPSYWEFPTVHLANFCIALFSLAGFQFFLSSLLRSVRGRLEAVPEWTVVAIGFAAFLYTTLDFTNLAIVTPDLLMHSFVYFAAGFLVRIAWRQHGWREYFTLGLILGAGYLAKAPCLIYAAVCAIILLLIQLSRPQRVLVYLAGFVVVAAPYIVFLSYSKHRLTWGDSGHYNVAWMLNGVPYYHWQGGPPDSGTPLHSTRRISNDPPAFEFATPVAGTYPPWFDPIYWNEGAQWHYRAGEIAAAAWRGLKLYEYLVHRRQVVLLAGLLILMLATPRKQLLLRLLWGRWPLLVWGIFPFGMYALVHQDARFLSSFFVLLWMALYVPVLQATPAILTGVARSVVIVVGALMLAECLIVAGARPVPGPQEAAVNGNSPHPHWEIAHRLTSLGIQPGDRVAIVGNRLPYFWARLARVRIVSEVLMDDPPCGRAGMERSGAQWLKVKDAIAATGAKVIVSPCIHGVVEQTGWQELGDTGVFAYKF